MRFKAFTVSQADFESWAAHQLQPAKVAPPALRRSDASAAATPPVAPLRPARCIDVAGRRRRLRRLQPAPACRAPAQTPVTQAGFIAFPHDKMPAYAIPQTPLPADLAFDDNLLAEGDAANGAKLVSTGHVRRLPHDPRRADRWRATSVRTSRTSASRTTIAAGLYPNDAQHLARWIKNAAKMKPGVADAVVRHR